jgi:uncharacterized protein (DUF1800 family)
MAFALSEILVVSGNGEPLYGYDTLLAYYYDTLVKDAFGNYGKLLQDVTLSPTMGRYLSMMKNDKANPATGVHADQNYAREIMQLFSIGLVKLNIDGSVQTDSHGKPVPTFTLEEVINLSNALTGWASTPTSNAGDNAWRYDLNQTAQMIAYEDHHDRDVKTILGGVRIPTRETAEADLKIALHTIFNHPNVGPFLGKQLIQRLVTSNPSPGYVQRVAEVFNNDGTGVRGNLFAVAKAILTDPEAVSPSASNSYGKLREPLLRITSLWRAFNAYNGNNEQFDYYLWEMAYEWLGETPLNSPTVFNFFQPSFQVAGPMAAAGLVAPEFQITNEATIVYTANALQLQAYKYMDSAGEVHVGPDYPINAGNGDVLLHTAQWEPLAAKPATLVDEMNIVLMAGQMSSEMRAALIRYVSAIPASSAGARVAETAELIVSSPQYAVQR